MAFRLIIAGSRTFSDYELLKREVDKMLAQIPEDLDVEIVSGGADGADKLGEKYAVEYGLSVTQFLPDWSQGKKAGILRNIEMGDYADALIAFWDGSSRGTKHMLEYATKKGLWVEVVLYEQKTDSKTFE